MSALLYYSESAPADLWAVELEKSLPTDVELRIYPQLGNLVDINFALCWKPKPGLLASLPNLQLIFSMAAGFDHILQDPERPIHVPIVRIIDHTLSNMMAEYAIYAVLGFHRHMLEFTQDQRDNVWAARWPRYTADVNVGILGIGAIGTNVANKLSMFGFQVHGWSRSQKSLRGITCHYGQDGLSEMLPLCEQIVCVLPLTEETKGILNNETLNTLPKGSYVTNIGRGGHINDADLLEALNSGQIAGAFLDVFSEEPLPQGHPYWQHNKVIMTPHIAGEVIPKSCAKSIANNISRFRSGQPICGIANLDRGY